MKKLLAAAVAAAMTMTATFAMADGAIKIGEIGPLTGAAAIYGTAVANGAQIAIDELNALGGQQYELNAQDDEADAEKSVNAYNNLLDWGAQMMLATVTTNPCIAVGAQAYEDRVFMLTPSASSSDVTADKDNVYQVCFTDPAQGTHEITFSRHLWIEAEDFMEVPVPKYKRLTPNGPECRLKGAYLVQCTGCVKDADGNVTEVLCTYDPESSGGDPADGRKVKGATLHWVDAENCMDAEVRLYDNLFSDEQPDGPDKDFLDCLNPESLTVLTGCKVEPEMRKVAEAFDKQADRTGVNAPTFQFMRVGYFCLDNRDSSAAHMVFNRSVSLKDSFKK